MVQFFTGVVFGVFLSAWALEGMWLAISTEQENKWPIAMALGPFFSKVFPG